MFYLLLPVTCIMVTLPHWSFPHNCTNGERHLFVPLKVKVVDVTENLERIFNSYLYRGRTCCHLDDLALLLFYDDSFKLCIQSYS